MSRFVHRNFVVTSTALAGLMSVALLHATGPAAAADASYCHAQFRACQKRFSTRTCDNRYDYCMAYSVSAPSTTIVIGGFPRFHKPRPKADPKTDPKTPPKTGPIGNPVPKAPTTGTNAPAGGGKGPGGVVVVPGGWPGGGKGGGNSGGGANAGGGGTPPRQNLMFQSAGGRSGGR